MNSEIAAIIILIGSFLGIAVITYRKMRVLAQLPEIIEKPGENFWLRLKNKITNLSIFKFFSFEKFLQKMLSHIKILTLKTENKISSWLQKLREKSKNKKLTDDNYWQELKKITKKTKK